MYRKGNSYQKIMWNFTNYFIKLKSTRKSMLFKILENCLTKLQIKKIEDGIKY